MTSTDSTQPEAPYDEGYTQEDLVLAQIKARRLSAASNLVLGLLVLAVLLFTVYIAKTGSDRAEAAEHQAQDNGEQIVDLTEQLNDITQELVNTREALETAQATNDEVESCSAKLSAMVRNATRDSIGSLLSFVVVISTTLPSESMEKVGPLLEQAAKISEDYRKATEMTNAWNALPADQKLPCPV